MTLCSLCFIVIFSFNRIDLGLWYFVIDVFSDFTGQALLALLARKKQGYYYTKHPPFPQV